MQLLKHFVTEISSCIGKIKDFFENQNKVPRNWKLTLEIKKKVLDCYVISNSDNFVTNKKKIKMWFYWWLPGTEYSRNEEVLRRRGSTKKLHVAIRKKQAKTLGHIIKGLENSTLIGYING